MADNVLLALFEVIKAGVVHYPDITIRQKVETIVIARGIIRRHPFFTTFPHFISKDPKTIPTLP